MIDATSSTDTRLFTWRVEAGEREVLRIPMFNAAGDPADLTGWDIDVQIKTRPGGQLLYEFPPTQVTMVEHHVELVVPAPVSAAWAWRTGWWRMRVTAPDSDPDDPDTARVIEGALIVAPD